MRTNQGDFVYIQPDRVNHDTIDLCDSILKEPPAKAFARTIYSRWLKYKYKINPMGKGFQWGRWEKWDLRRGVLKVGHYVFIAPGAYIYYPTVIGDLCMIAKDVHFVGNDHGFDEIGFPIRIAKPKINASTTITVVESEVWVGQRSTIFAGLRIGRGSIIAAGSIVTKDVPPYSIVAGVPANVIRERFKSEEDKIEHIRKLYG